ncbi:pilus assembly protein PilM [Vibrio sp. M60_M31a]
MDKRIVTGIDIGHNSLKAVVLKPNGEQFALLGYKEILLKDGIVAENNTINHQEIVNTLKQVKKDLPFGASRVAISVPDNAVISKKLHIEQDLEENEIEFAVVQALFSSISVPVDELSLDFVRLNHEGGLRGPVSYQVFATRKDVVEVGLKQYVNPALNLSSSKSIHKASGRYGNWPQNVSDKSQYGLLDVGSVSELFHDVHRAKRAIS